MATVAHRRSAAEPGELASARLFRTLDDAQRRAVLARGEVIEVPAGTTVVEEGSTGEDLYVVLSGAADVTVGLGTGDHLTVGVLRPGDSFGELGALLRERRAATVIATEDTRLLRLGGRELAGLVEEIGVLGLALSRNLARDLEGALGERNELEVAATPVEVAEPSASRASVGRYYLTTARNALSRQRLLTTGPRPLYTAELSFTPEEEERWRELFGVDRGGPAVPLTLHVPMWTAQLMQLAQDLGINFRNLSHFRTRLTFDPEGRLPRAGEPHQLQLRAIAVRPAGDDAVGILVETQLSARDGARLLTALDAFLVAKVDRGTVRSLARQNGGSDHDEFLRPPDREERVLDGGKTGVHESGLALADDLGIRYGRLSGNLDPAHTSRAGARLLGHERPFLQHLCLVNLVLRHVTEARDSAPRRLEAAFVAPVHAGSTVQLAFDGRRFELTDEDGELLVAGTVEAGAIRADREGTGPSGGAAAEPAEAAEAAGPAEAAAPGELTDTSEPGEPEEAAAPTAPSSGPVEERLEVPVAALRGLLDGEHGELRRRVRTLVSGPDFHIAPELSRDEYRTRVSACCRLLADEGFGALALPRELGGRDDAAAAIAVFETLVEHDLSLVVKFGVQFGLFAGAILHLGTERHHERYLRRAGTLELPGCFALTETGHGSNARGIRTRAVYDPVAESFLLTTPDDDARKDYIGNAARDGQLAVVFAQLEVGGEEHGVHAFVVPIRDEHGAVAPGVRIEDCGPKVGLNGVDNGRLWFDGVRVPWDALLDRYGTVSIDGVYRSPVADPSARFFTMLSTLVQGRVSVGLGAVAASRAALTIAVRYGDRRRQFGPTGAPETPLLDYRTHQRRLLIPLASTYALHFALRDLVDDYLGVLRSPDATPRERMQLETVAAGLKSVATWHAMDTIQVCREACGGKGYLAENRFGALRADTDIFTTFEGDNTVLMQLVTKTLLTDYRQQFQDLDLPGTVRFLVGQVLASVVPSPASRRDDAEHLRDRGFQLEAMRTREQLQLTQLARRLRRTLDRGVAPHDAFIRHQPRIMQTAAAHVDRVVLERFAAAVDDCGDPGLVPVLSRLCDLHALSTLERHRDWFLQEGVFAGVKTRAIAREVDRLCGELRPHATALVDAFGIPDVLLRAPIGLGSPDGVAS